MTDTPGQGQAESLPEPQPEPPAPQQPVPPPFGAPTPGSVAQDPPADPGYGQPPGPSPYDRPAPPAPYGQPGAVPPGYARAASAALTPAEERNWGMLAHLSAILAGLFCLSLVGPLIVYAMYKDRSPFVRRHATESLNFQISLLVYLVVGGILSLFLLFLAGPLLFVLVPVYIVASITALVLIVMGCIAGNDGREFRYPLTLRFVH